MVHLALVVCRLDDDDFDVLLLLGGGAKTSQNRNVSSPAADKTVPVGPQAKCKTRLVCPSKSRILAMLGYFHKLIWFRANPCDDTISFSYGFQSKAQTCDPVSMELSSAPVLAFQNLMVRSAVPAPDASK